MIRFLAGRPGFAALILLVLSTFVFFLFFVAPRIRHAWWPATKPPRHS
ncbi:hypothetical protein N8D56_26940 (plasmid) [Devosia sp. A8/3-2]|nr:hypothetical protein N8D56_26940 [Devosia sp. A8/3-2]